MIKNQKSLFTLDKDVHYLNCAYKSPLLKSTEQAAQNALIRDRNPFKIGINEFFGDAAEVKSEFGKLINAPSSHIAIIPSTSYAIATVLRNIKPKKGQHALSIENEFPSEHLGLKKWSDTHNAELKIINTSKAFRGDQLDHNQKIIDRISDETSLLMMSAIHWMNGLKFDLKAIGEKCKAHNVLFIVDGTQSVGALEMNVNDFNIDVLICAAYKWLFGPYSTGLAYFGEKFHQGEPIEESWMNRTNANDFANLTDYGYEYGPDATRFNVGQQSNFILLPMLKEALKQVNSWGTSMIQDFGKQLNTPLFAYLESLGLAQEIEQNRTQHLFGIQLHKIVDENKLRQKLIQEKVHISVRGENLRVALHLFNTEEDIQKLIACIDYSKK